MRVLETIEKGYRHMARMEMFDGCTRRLYNLEWHFERRKRKKAQASSTLYSDRRNRLTPRMQAGRNRNTFQLVQRHRGGLWRSHDQYESDVMMMRDLLRNRVSFELFYDGFAANMLWCRMKDGAFGGLKSDLRGRQEARFALVQKFTTVNHQHPHTTTVTMAPSRAYIPSRALLRALSRPLPPRCPFARPLSARFVRNNGTKATKLNNEETKKSFSDDVKLKFPKHLDEHEADSLPDDVIDNPNLPTISWYEQDLDGAGPERLISRLATPADRRKHNELSKMLEEDLDNPHYDDALLNRRLLDDLMTNPNFADLTEELQTLKAGIMTREESKLLEEEARKEQEPQLKELESSLKMATYESIQELIDDPALGDVRDDLEDLQGKLPDGDDMQEPEFQAALQRVEEKLAGNAAFQRKMAALQEQQGLEEKPTAELLSAEKDFDTIDEDTPIDSPEALDKLLVQMKELMGSMGGDKELEAELDAVINEDPFAETDGDMEKELDFDELSQELTKLVKNSVPADGSPATDENGDVVDPELEAKVDKIMQDPKLVQKLMYIKQLITEEQSKAHDITTIAHETAPDPLTLESARTTSLQDQMRLAKSDPEHLAAIHRLRVDLLPPFNISPALKSFNQAIELSYVGANDDIRRILWRAYSKARTLPTFLQNLPADAWDLLYYSQAVTWGSNQNRQSHLKTLLHDLKSVGRDGPPTHPSTLVRN